MIDKTFIKENTNIVEYDLEPTDLKRNLTNGN